MHELSIAGAVVDIVNRHAGGRRVTKVELRVGHLRQVVPSALEFAFELVAEGTPAEGAVLEMEEVPATVACRRCQSETTLAAFPAQCGTCGSLDVDVTGGEELLVDALELEEEELLTRSGG
jgi:hydrogenase nickel incorporation protein HypA/HybF